MYNHSKIEKKWQDFWEENKTFKTNNDFSKPKYYCLDMFPYPSGAGLHVGHPEGYTANDIIARYKKAKGFNLLHPMGWDAFGLPAENYAIKTGTHPRITTDQNITTFKKQIASLGFSYDWDREIDTTNPEYYKWTQWIFLKLFEKGLAYEQDLPINYCPSCKTGLANEEVLNDFSCERCGEQVEKKRIRQWVLAITKYADRLLKDVDKLDWPEGIKDMQRNWIGRSEGCEFDMKVLCHPELVSGSLKSKNTINDSEISSEGQIIGEISVYTTRIDTVFGMTYAVLAPDHKDVEKFITEKYRKDCEKYIKKANTMSDQDRTADDKEKTGVFTGSYVINPFNGKKVPIWIADYVLGNYGTGAVMAVPAHDERDFEFAKKYNLEIIQSITPIDKKEVKGAFTNLGILVNSGEFSGLRSKEAQEQLIDFATKNGFGEKKVNYKLRDWLFSRQRYWGEPIPLIHLDIKQIKTLDKIEDISEATDKNKAYILKRKPKDGENTKGVFCKDGSIRELIIGGKVFSKIFNGLYSKIVCDYNLPLELPEVKEYKPAGDGNSPLAKVKDFVNIKLADNLVGKRETNTMPQWGGSCWYYLRFMDPDNTEALVDQEVEKYWGQVDSYVGGAEHAVLHLLYARFWHKFLFDIGVVSNDEPFYRLRNQGLIQSYIYENPKGKILHNDLVEEKNGKFYDKETGDELKRKIGKMSKSLGNVINPDDIIKKYGADSLRLYEMYMAEFKDSAPWNTKNIIGVRRFIERVDRLFNSVEAKIAKDDLESIRLLNKTIKKVGEDIESYKFNTAIAQMMILSNYGRPRDKELFKEWKEKFAIILSPFIPHLAEELWKKLGNTKSIFFASWPKYDNNIVIDNTVTIAIQVLGKVRGTIEISKEENKESVIKKAKQEKNVAKWIEGKKIIKEIYIPGKIVNLVIK